MCKVEFTMDDIIESVIGNAYIHGENWQDNIRPGISDKDLKNYYKIFHDRILVRKHLPNITVEEDKVIDNDI